MSVIHNGKRKKMVTENHERKRKRTDGIDNLTDDALCHILSFLSTKEAARTSILSKRWKDLWQSSGSIKLDMDEVLGVFPHVKLDMDGVLGVSPRVNEEDRLPYQRIMEFFRLVTRCLCDDFNPLTKTLHLHLCSSLPNARIQYWFSLMIRRQLENLVLDFSGAPEYCNIPCYLLFHGGCRLRVKSLSLTHCDLLKSYNATSNHCCSSLVSLALVDVILPEKFIDFISCCPLLRCLTIQDCFMENIEMKILRGGSKHLRVLELRHVKLTQELVNNLLANFFLLEQLSLEDCDVMPFDASTLEICGLMNLDCLKISKCCGLKELRVFASSLRRFAFISNNDMELLLKATFELLDDHGDKFSSIPGQGSPLKHLHLQRSKFSTDIQQFSSLETVTLEEMELEEADIIDLLSNCLLLKKLSIIKCDGFDSLNIIGPSLQLEQLTVRWCNHLKEIEICDVNLIRLEYHGQMIVFCMQEVPQLASVEMEIDANDDDNSLTNALLMLSRDVPQLETLIFYVQGGKVPKSPPMFYHLKHLMLFLGPYLKAVTEEVSWATIFLEASPFLENFHLQLSRCLPEGALISGTRKPTPLADWKFTYQYLKEIEMTGFKGDIEEIEFACNLLRNVKSSLKMMKINGGSKHRAGWHTAAPPLEWVQRGRQKTLKEIMSKIGAVPASVELLIL